MSEVSAEFSVTVNPMAASETTCATCKFMAAAGNGLNVCKRFPPPAPAFSVPPGGAQSWPLVSVSDWCGEYAPTANKSEQGN